MILFSSLIIQNLWDPQKIFCLDTITHIWSSGFGDSITQKTEWWRPKMKTHFPCFQNSSPMTQWQFRNKLSQWAPSPMHCPIHLRLVMTVRASPVTLHFSENFLLKIFPFLTSLSQPLLIFTSLLIPNELAPWHHNPYSKTKPGLRRSSVFEEQRLIEALNQAGIFTGEFSSLSPCPYFSLPFPGATLSPRCSKSVSLPLHFPCPWSGFGLGFSLDVKGVFDLFYWCWLWLVRHVDWILLIWIFGENFYHLTLIP